ncbi:2'-5' RNA ligase family protein [Aquipuribacter sp. SD81]|uniref:2'-5' RNA ligase family protein n=1 Tax=Aquipuribacter sp. SD81 TaxID=3127703 RepID=UPI0030191023
MVQSVELLPGGAVEAWVRAQWAALADADLPSLAHHQGETNRPHVTLAVAGSVTADAETALEAALSDGAWRAAAVRPGGFVVFGPHGRGGRFVLARLAVPSPPLLALHEVVARAWQPATDVPPTSRPGAWTPHVTLASRLTAAQLADAVVVAGAVAAPAAYEADTAVPPRGVRRWDGDGREERWLTGVP